MSFDFSGRSEEEIYAGNDGPLPGWYCAKIEMIDDSLERGDFVIVDYRILSGTTPGMERKKHREFYSLSENAKKRLEAFCIATGLAKAGQKTSVNLTDAVGKPVVIECVEDEYNGKKRVKVSFLGVYSPDHPKGREVPRPAGGLQADDGGGNGGSGGQSSSSDDDWAGF